jgi:hypothetical protein
MVRAFATRGARATAMAVLLVSLVLAVKLPALWSAASYLGVLTGVLVGLGVLAAVRLWFGGHLEGRLAAGLVAALALTGQLLNATLGLPGASALQGPIGTWGLLAVVGELAVLGLLGRDALRGKAR